MEAATPALKDRTVQAREASDDSADGEGMCDAAHVNRALVKL